MKVHVLLEAAKEAAKDANKAIILEPGIADGALTADMKMKADGAINIERIMSLSDYRKYETARSQDSWHSYYESARARNRSWSYYNNR